MCVCVCVGVGVCERERECVCVCVLVYACVRHPKHYTMWSAGVATIASMWKFFENRVFVVYCLLSAIRDDDAFESNIFLVFTFYFSLYQKDVKSENS